MITAPDTHLLKGQGLRRLAPTKLSQAAKYVRARVSGLPFPAIQVLRS